MKKAVILAFFLVFAGSALGQAPAAGFDLSNYGVRIEPDKRVMVVLATLEAARTTNAAGEMESVIKTPLSEAGEAFREQLNSDLAALNEDLRGRISTFVIQYKKRNPGAKDAELIAPFVSMAYALSPVPDLGDPVVTTDLPGNLLDVLDFAPLVRDFYRRSSFSGNLNEYVKLYQAAADRQLRPTAREMVSDILGYLHTRPQLVVMEKVTTEAKKSGTKHTNIKNVELRERERKFTIVPEMLAPASAVTFLNVKDEYAVIVPPDTDLSFSESRRAFIQFVVDPVILSNSKDIATIRDGVKKLLDERRKTQPTLSPDVYLTISRSLVAAIDAKQSENVRVRIATQRSRDRIAGLRTDAEKQAVVKDLEKFKREQADETVARLSEDYERGAVLDFYFADQLKGVEDSGFDLAASMREMILSLDPTKEVDRLAQFADARKRGIAAREERKKNINSGSSIVSENPVTVRLAEIQKAVTAKNYVQAAADLKALSGQYPDEARVYYNLGRVTSFSAESLTDAAQQKAKLLEAKAAYEEVVKIAQAQIKAGQGARVDRAAVSLSYVAIAKIYEFYDEKEYAKAVYDAAIKIGDVQGGAYNEALTAKARLIKEP